MNESPNVLVSDAQLSRLEGSSMAVEGPLLKWVAVHRRHHQHSDTDEDHA